MAEQKWIEAPDGGVKLLGGRCTRCGEIYFPHQPLGCERCGAFGEALRVVELPAEGVVRNVTTVNLAAPGASPPPPYDVAEIALLDGPILRALLSERTTVRLGEVVRGQLVPGALGVSHDVRFARMAERRA